MESTAFKTEQGHRRLWIALVAVSGVLLIASLIPWIRGVPDAYPHQHRKQLLGGVIANVCLTGLTPRYAKWWLSFATVVFLAGGFWLGWR